MRKPLILLAALWLATACSARATFQSKTAGKAWAFTGPTVDSVVASLKPGDRLSFKVDEKGLAWVRVNDGTWLNEARPCPPFPC